MSENGLQELLNRGRLHGLKSVELGLCEDCTFKKQKRVSFLKGGKGPQKEKLEVMHTDLCCPAPRTSLDGASYYMTFIDDYTRKIWVYFLKNKSVAFVTFWQWKTLVENETDLKVKCLQSDNDCEYDYHSSKVM